ncbi:MAG: AAA family ATPase [Vicinamibacterales bacterium]
MSTAHRKAIEAVVNESHRLLIEQVKEGGRLAVVKAPPGSGKTYLLMKAVEAAVKSKMRVAIATQTRAQSDDICYRLVSQFKVKPIRFAAASSLKSDPPYAVVTDKKELPQGPCVVVATSAKWGMIKDPQPFDILFVDEAWQLAWADFMLLGHVAGRFVLIGDPGQIPPVVTIDTGRWETAPRAPHHAAPELVLAQKPRDLLPLELPATRRLPHDTVDYIRPFYDFHFGAWAEPGDRQVLSNAKGRDGIDKAIEKLSAGSVVALTIPTPAEGPPLEQDDEIAELATQVAARLLKREASARIGSERRELEPKDIGLCSTHRVMNAAMELKLPKGFRRSSRVDTPERWQGLECPVMVIAHPLSGVVRPSDFDLETGRLCVMASRHQAGLIIVTRDHIGRTLDQHLPSAEQPLGRPDVAGRGHLQHQQLWDRLLAQDRVVQL